MTGNLTWPDVVALGMFFMFLFGLLTLIIASCSGGYGHDLDDRDE